LLLNTLVLDYRLTQWQPLCGTYVCCQRKVHSHTVRVVRAETRLVFFKTTLLLHWLKWTFEVFHKLTSSLVVDCSFLSSSFHF